ncbi:MAG TPA: ABC transporter ATP-binding protein [Sphingobacteriaceae bacterium]|nr:ABC transporter ATP-binding protein [Sphingobacteriaceae bacterium]
MAEPILTIEGLQAGYGAMQVLHEVDMTVNAGETVCIIGPNGAGKSTVLKAIFSQVDIYGGRIVWQGDDITGAQPRDLIRRGLAYVPQGSVVFPSLTVRENLFIGVRSLGLPTPPGALEEVLAYFPDLTPRLEYRAGLLSGGQQQMVAIARGLMSRPSLLLLDEPSLGLAPALVQQMFAIVNTLRDEGKAILLVEQNARQALAVSDRGYVLELGRNRYTGTGQSLLNDPKVQELYLGGRITAG